MTSQDDAIQMHHNVMPCSALTEYSFKGLEEYWFLIQMRWGPTREKKGNSLTLLTLCQMQHSQEALLWASKAIPYKAVTPSTLRI